MSGGGIQPGFVRSCVEVDTVTNTCTTEAWMPPPAMLPKMSAAEAAVACAFIGAAWFIGHITHTIRRAAEDD